MFREKFLIVCLVLSNFNLPAESSAINGKISTSSTHTQNATVTLNDENNVTRIFHTITDSAVKYLLNLFTSIRCF